MDLANYSGSLLIMLCPWSNSGSANDFDYATCSWTDKNACAACQTSVLLLCSMQRGRQTSQCFIKLGHLQGFVLHAACSAPPQVKDSRNILFHSTESAKLAV
jgi:hypothetical protein